MGPIGSVAAAAAASTPGSAPPRLVRAAHEFEAQMLKELLQPLSKSSELPGDEEDSGGVLGEFASEAFAGALSARGGFGIARQITHDLSQSGNRSAMTPVIGNRRIDTGIRGGK